MSPPPPASISVNHVCNHICNHICNRICNHICCNHICNHTLASWAPPRRTRRHPPPTRNLRHPYRRPVLGTARYKRLGFDLQNFGRGHKVRRLKEKTKHEADHNESFRAAGQRASSGRKRQRKKDGKGEAAAPEAAPAGPPPGAEDVSAAELAAVGRRVRVWWPIEAAWFYGTLQNYTAERGSGIIYDDGDGMSHFLTADGWVWRVVEEDEAVPAPPPDKEMNRSVECKACRGQHKKHTCGKVIPEHGQYDGGCKACQGMHRTHTCGTCGKFTERSPASSPVASPRLASRPAAIAPPAAVAPRPAASSEGGEGSRAALPLQRKHAAPAEQDDKDDKMIERIDVVTM